MKKYTLYIVGVISVLLAVGGLSFYQANKALQPQKKEFDFYIRRTDSKEKIISNLFDSLNQPASLNWQIAMMLKRNPDFKPGKYLLSGNMSALEVINKFRSGDQEPVRIRLDDIRTPQQLAARYERNFESDSLAMMNFISQSLAPKVTAATDSLKQFGVQRSLIFILGDTYDFWWSTTPQEFFERLKKLHDEYWTSDKMEAAKQIGMTEEEIYILASIVKCETRDFEDARKAAGLYLNRLRMNKKLESDPTAKFDLKLRDQIQRVYNEHVKNDSPYNTYRNFGLPPAPIFVVEKKYIDAVLNYYPSNYLYMCAEPGGKGTHRYTNQYSEHLRNSKDYHDWLDSKNIR